MMRLLIEPYIINRALTVLYSLFDLLISMTLIVLALPEMSDRRSPIILTAAGAHSGVVTSIQAGNIVDVLLSIVMYYQCELFE